MRHECKRCGTVFHTLAELVAHLKACVHGS